MQSLAAALALAASVAPAQDAGGPADEWNFTATLDGRPIGTHRFVVSGAAADRHVDSRARFVVSVMGLPVYRYRHEARERWEGDCLRELRADTDDDGRREQVEQRFATECTMGYAYWNPRVVSQQQLVDPQTGRVQAVRFERVPDAEIAVGGRPVPAHGWRLLAGTQRITIWYAADSGRWIALDAAAEGGRRLSYRIPPAGSPP